MGVSVSRTASASCVLVLHAGVNVTDEAKLSVICIGYGASRLVHNKRSIVLRGHHIANDSADRAFLHIDRNNDFAVLT